MDCYFSEKFFCGNEDFRPWLPSRGDDFVSGRSPTMWPREVGPETYSGYWASPLTPRKPFSPPPPEHEMPRFRNSEPPGPAAFNVVQNCPKFVPQHHTQNNGCVEKQVRESKQQKTSHIGVVCNFCRQNGDRREFYSDHSLKDSEGNVVCPVLRCHRCELCGATGSRAHTRSYCPRVMNGSKRNATSLKKTLHDSSGRVRPAHVR